MEEAKTDVTYCLKPCNKECWRKASKYVFKGGERYSYTRECIKEGYIKCPICKQSAKLLYTEEYEYIWCEQCKRKIDPPEQIRIIRKEKEGIKDE